MAKKIEVYTTGYCPYCVRAKTLLDDKGLDYTEINPDGKAAELVALKERTGQRTVPPKPLRSRSAKRIVPNGLVVLGSGLGLILYTLLIS